LKRWDDKAHHGGSNAQRIRHAEHIYLDFAISHSALLALGNVAISSSSSYSSVLQRGRCT
jgi:hypothetical protein